MTIETTNPAEDYTYDKNHNRVTSKTARAYGADGKPAPIDYNYDDSSRLTEDSRFFYAYDPNGNLTRKVAKQTR